MIKSKVHNDYVAKLIEAKRFGMKYNQYQKVQQKNLKNGSQERKKLKNWTTAEIHTASIECGIEGLKPKFH